MMNPADGKLSYIVWERWREEANKTGEELVVSNNELSNSMLQISGDVNQPSRLGIQNHLPLDQHFYKKIGQTEHKIPYLGGHSP